MKPSGKQLKTKYLILRVQILPTLQNDVRNSADYQKWTRKYQKLP